MHNFLKIKGHSTHIKMLSIALAVGWFIVIAVFFLWQVRAQKNSAIAFARTEAVGSYNKDLLYRRWATKHGGVYVPVTEETPPNPYLSNVQEREIYTSSGTNLTLVNPAYMTRQVFELGKQQYSVKGHITSLNLIRPENKPDEWEKKALHLFENGLKEFSEVSMIDKEAHFRFMRPMVVEKGCLKCHGYQGYKVGEIRGGISVSVPMAQYSAIASYNIKYLSLIHGIILLLGFGGIWGAFYSIGKNYRERQRAEERLNLAIGATRDGIWDWNIQTNETLFAPRWCQIVGYSEDYAEQTHTFDSWASRIHPDDYQIVMEALKAHLEEQKLYDVKYRHKHKNGNYRWQQSRGKAVFDASGKPIRMVGSISDIHPDQKLVQKLKESEERFRKYFELGSIGMAITSPDKGWVEFNDYVCNLFGYSREELFSFDWAQLTHPDDLEKDLGPFTKMLDGAIDGYKIEKRFIHKKSHEIVTNLSVSGLRNNTGGIAYFLVTIEDITDRKREEQELASYRDKLEDLVKERTLELQYANETLEEEVQLRKEAESLLKKSQARLVNAIETIDDAFVLYDADDRLVICNKKYKEIYHESADLMIPGKTFEEIIRKGAERGEYSQAVGRVDEWVNERLALHRRACSTLEQQLSDGTWLKITEKRLQNGDTVGFRVDITHYKLTEEALRKIQEDLEHKVEKEVGTRLALEQEQRKMELRIQQAQKMETIGALAGGIAHDFNNILFPILGHSELLLEEIPSNNTSAYESINQIRLSGLRAKKLVEQILTFSRHEEVEYRPLRVQLILKEVIKFLRSTISKNIELSQHIDPKCRTIMADATQIHQIIMNLTTNACHAMENGGGHLSVELREVSISERDSVPYDLSPGNYALLSVSDTGVGIPHDIIEKVFEPYFTTKKKGKGTGIGLSVVLAIVKKMNGTIRVQSEEGKGSKFEAYFPIQEKSERHFHVPETMEKLPMGHERILLVDDEEPITYIQSQILERLGYSVSKHTSSIEALNAFKDNPDAYDLVLSDFNMPQMNGDQLASEILLIKPEAPIIICTGFSEGLDGAKAQQIGIRSILMKPVTKVDIANEVRKILDQGNENHIRLP